MKAAILKCKQGARFHFGEYSNLKSEDLSHITDYIHSDLIFGAFISTLSTLYPDKIDNFKHYFANGEIRISSAFYCFETADSNYIYLLPKPIILNLYRAKSEDFDTKKMKKIQFLSKGLWEKGIAPDYWFCENSECFSPNSKSLFLKDELPNHRPFALSEKTDSIKTRVRTEEVEDNLYSQTDLVIMGNEYTKIHWYFLFEDSLPPDIYSVFIEVLKRMVENGIGGDRYNGAGCFTDVDIIDNFSFNITDVSEKCATLSLIFPSEENKEKYLYYQTKKRGGMHYGKGKRLAAITAITEGAIINGDLEPRIIDLSENNKKYWKYSGNITVNLPKSFIV